MPVFPYIYVSAYVNTMKLFEMTGKMALGSRLRKLSDTITENATKIYEMYGVDIEPRWFPVFFMLSHNERMGITEIAERIDQTHASVSQVIKQMKKKGLITEVKDRKDGRRNVVALSDKGRNIIPRISDQYTDVGAAIEELIGEMQYDLWKAMEETEYLLTQKSLLDRVVAKRKAREAAKVKILDYSPSYQPVFKSLNVEWIEKYFHLEEKDLISLNNPDTYIIDKGGHILLAEYEGELVGTAALLKLDEETMELAKMAVSPKAQGKNIGYLLGQACIEKAKEMGAKKLFLESNTKLVPAISLYRKLGFMKVTGRPSPYERSNIQMELEL